jgi:HPt (histidine-containing phosphotransfer) domain-containing protein
MDGIQTVANIRALRDDDSYYQKVPIVALTADAVFGSREVILRKGFDDYLSKPIDTNKLNGILERWIPKEKQKKQAEAGRAGPEPIDHDLIAKIKINGLNIERGLAMSGGKKERYLKILSLFYKDGLEKIKEIKLCLETNNIQLYVVHVHALKSASAIIGAEKLSAEAEELETAGKHGNSAFIYSHSNTFIVEMEALIRDINAFLSEKTEKKALIDKEALKTELLRLKTALNAFDFSEINTAVNYLQEFTQVAGIGDSISTILQNKMIGEYDEAVAIIDTLLQKLEA